MPITKETIKRGLTARDILDRVKEPKQPKISKLKRANIIIDRVVKEKTIRGIAEDNNVDKNTPLAVLKDNKEVIRHIQTKSTELKESIRDKYLNLLDNKANITDNKALSRTKATELSGVIKDLDTIIRLDKGEATSITHNLSESEARLELERSLEVLKDNDLIKLTERVFKTDN